MERLEGHLLPRELFKRKKIKLVGWLIHFLGVGSMGMMKF